MKHSRRPFVLLLFSGVLALSAVIQHGADTLPSEINDKDFWRMIAEFSEAGGNFPYENFLSNEVSIQQVIPDLRGRVKPGGVYLGVAPEQNFTYVAALESRMAFIIDIRRQNMLEHLLYKALFEMSANRADFVARLFSRKRPQGLDEKTSVDAMFAVYNVVPSDAAYYAQNLRDVNDTLARHGYPLSSQDLQAIEYVYNVFYRGGPNMTYAYASASPNNNMPSYVSVMTAKDPAGRNWAYLAQENSFRYIKEMQRKNLIVPLIGDFAGPRALRSVGQYLKDHGATVNAFYVSNVERYLTGAKWPAFYANAATLPVDSSSVFIRFVDGDYTRYLMGWTSEMGNQTGLVPMPEMISLLIAGRLPSYTQALGMQKASRY